VHEAEHLVEVAAHDRESGVTVLDHDGLRLGHGRVAVDPADLLAGHHRRARVAAPEIEHAREQVGGEVLDEALLVRRRQHHGQLLGGMGGGQRGAGFDAQHPQPEPGEPGEHPDHRPEHREVGPVEGDHP